jgi:hypothetical protein
VSLRLRASLLGVALLAGALTPIATAGVACAADSAALVVSTGSNNYTYCVDLGGGSVDGIELIQRAGSQHGLQYKLGFGGNAVCMLANVGASGNDCFGEHPNFWGFWRGNGSGGWNWSGTGAGNVTIQAGDVNGWAWGTGDSGSTHPAPPATTYESVCAGAPRPEPKPQPNKPGNRPSPEANRSGGSTNDSVSGTQAGGAIAQRDQSGARPSEKADSKDGSKGRGGRERNIAGGGYATPVPSPSATTTPVTAANPAGAEAPDRGPPVAAFVALALTVLLGALGVVLVRRRRLEEG